jgi:signal recognition particle receptor subunit alpha
MKLNGAVWYPICRRAVATQGDPIDDLIRTVLLEERSGQTSLVKDQYCVRWTLANDANLVFVVVFQKFLIAKAADMDDLLRRVKRAFLKTFAVMLPSLQLRGHGTHARTHTHTLALHTTFRLTMF